MRNVKRVHSSIRRSGPLVPPAPSEPGCALERHELHRVVDGDWPPSEPNRAELRASLAAGLAAVAMLPVVELLLDAWPAAPREVAAAIASLPLVALLVVVLTWRSEGEQS